MEVIGTMQAMQNTCKRETMIEKVYEFITPQEPRVERYTMRQLQEFVQMCDEEIAIKEVEKAKWEAMISEALEII